MQNLANYESDTCIGAKILSPINILLGPVQSYQRRSYTCGWLVTSGKSSNDLD
jgi:hypothetical protein